MPHERKDIVREQEQCMDEHALDETRRFLAAKLPGLAPTPTLQMRCLYQNTPDLSMLLGAHPDDESVIVACGFSGSGFQFAPAIGEFLARLCAAPGGGGACGSARDDDADDLAATIARQAPTMAAKFRIDRLGLSPR